jgi:CRP-like cAMP-binding protein
VTDGASQGDQVASESGSANDTFWGRLTAPEQAALSRVGTRRPFPPGAVILSQGDAERHLLVVLSGQVRVVTGSAHGREVLLAVCGPGQVLGELSAIDGAPRSATVQAVDAVEGLVVAGSRLPGVCTEFPHIAWVLLQVVAQRLRDADRQRAEFGGGTMVQRVVALLLELAAKHGQRTDSGILIAVPATQEQLAEMVAASRESVARVLRGLRQRGLVETKRSRITIQRIQELRRLADGDDPTFPDL